MQQCLPISIGVAQGRSAPLPQGRQADLRRRFGNPRCGGGSCPEV